MCFSMSQVHGNRIKESFRERHISYRIINENNKVILRDGKEKTLAFLFWFVFHQLHYYCYEYQGEELKFQIAWENTWLTISIINKHDGWMRHVLISWYLGCDFEREVDLKSNFLESNQHLQLIGNFWYFVNWTRSNNHPNRFIQLMARHILNASEIKTHLTLSRGVTCINIVNSTLIGALHNSSHTRLR